MAISQYGTLKEFNSDSESIKSYLERVDLYFTANSIADEKQVPVLLSVLGSPTYALLSDLLAPDAPGTKSLDNISTVLRKHFQPKRAVIAERFHFHRRQQTAEESISDYDAALRKLATHCEFGAYLNEALRDRFVCGLRSEAMQRRLLTEADLTLHRAMDVALSMEAADLNSKAFKGTEHSIKRLNKCHKKQSSSQTCYRCGKPHHSPADCRFKDAECHSCGKKGHIAPVCRSKPPQKSKLPMGRSNKRFATHQVEQDQTTNSDSESCYNMHTVTKSSSHPIQVTVKIEAQPLTMEVDTGAAVSIISDVTRKYKFPQLKLHKSGIMLKTYTDEALQVVGQLQVHVQYQGKVTPLVLIVVAGNGPSLFGRNWLKYIHLDWHRIATVHKDSKGLQYLLEQHKMLFEDGLGTIRPQKATLHVRSDAQPRFFKPRTVPFAIKDAVGKELDRLEQQGIIKKVNSSEWAAPIVPVPKKDGRFRLCGDYKVTINQALTIEQYPLPKPEDMFATLANGTLFSKLDLSQAYLQLQLDETSMPYVTVNTHQGLYQYTRLPFGVASAPAIFQRLMDSILQGIPGVICYIDDILVTGNNESDHLHHLGEVLKRLADHGFKLKKEKCTFLAESVEYLGHQIDKEGIRALPNKVEAIVNAPQPTNVQQLRSFLGLLNYYGKFVKNLSSILYPLNRLLQAQQKWKWTDECTQAFSKAKSQLTSSEVLIHYDPSLPITMAADASAYGIGAVISHVLPDGSEKPISFASRTLTTSEKNYAQLEKEALSLIFGVKKFHQYLYGRKFKLITDHKPLTAILGSKKGIPSLAAARLQRWAIILSGYDYEMVFKPTQQHCNADGLSRLPLPDTDGETAQEAVSVFNVAQLQALPVTFREVQIATRRDLILGKIVTYVQSGWPSKVPEELKPYHNKRDEMGIESGCLMWGIRVVIPQSLQQRVMEALHENHPGITRMKAVARSYMWWSGLDKDIENLSKVCLQCLEHKSKPAVAPLHPWVWPTIPWERVHIDFAGPFLDKMFLIVIDAHSKWPEVIQMSSTTAPKTIQALQALFSKYGLPQQLVSDNGPQFTADEFAQFTKANGIKHIRCAPYHPSSNGLAERIVQTFKKAMKAGERDGQSLTTRLSQFLLSYRSTPHATTNVSPSELFLKRKLRTGLDLLKPNLEATVHSKQSHQKKHHDCHSKPRQFSPGQLVMARDFRSKNVNKWVPGVIAESTGPVSYTVELGDGTVIRRHIDHLRVRSATSMQLSPYSSECTPQDFEFLPIQTSLSRPTTPTSGQDARHPARRYPTRDRHPPDRLMTYTFDKGGNVVT